MNWDDLRYVLAIARAESLSDAADALQVSVSTVSRRLRALEDEVGTQLFTKLTRGAVLSVAGEQMLAVAESMERLTHDLDAQIHGLDAKLEGTIRVTSLDELLKLWMGDFRDFQQHYTDIQLELMSGYAVANLTQREADVAIRVARQAPDHLIGRKHAQIHYAVYGSQELADQYADEATYNDYPWLAWDLSVGRGTDLWVEQNAPRARIISRIERMPVMVRALERSWGVTILPCFVGDANPKLRRIGDYLEGGAHVWVLSHPSMRGSARIRRFVGFVGELISRDKELIEGKRPLSP